MQKPDIITGTLLKEMFVAGYQWLAHHAVLVDQINVFPVPDGDTGTNMSLTMKAAIADFADIDMVHAGQIANRAAQNALKGARGNSGTILSQILQGFAVATRDKAEISIPDFATALEAASAKAHASVITPVEGTILTVIKSVAVASQHLANTVERFDQFLNHVLSEARQSLRSTPELLAPLKAAGVVDSGGQGLVYLLEGMVRHIQGLPIDMTVDHDTQKPAAANQLEASIDQPYDVQFLIQGNGLNVATIREAIGRMGTSALVVGDKSLVRVHVHVVEPEVPLTYGATQGALSDIVVENMAVQVQNRQHAPHQAVQTAIICVADGPGLAEIFTSLGATVIIEGWRTTDTITSQLSQAINGTKAANILILPNRTDCIALAKQAVTHFVSQQADVLATQSAPEGISALLAYDYTADLSTNVMRMQPAISRIQTVTVQTGTDLVTAYVNDQPIAEGSDSILVSLNALDTLDVSKFDLVSLYYGNEILPHTAQTLADSLLKRYPHLEVEVLDGGQPSSAYIISLE